VAMDFDGVDDKLKWSTAIVTAYPFTLSAWFNCDNVTALGALVSISDEATDNERWVLQADGASAGDPVRLRSVAAGTGVNAATSTGYTAGSWNHACGIGRSATSRDAYLNGGGKGSSAASNTPAGLDNTTLGLSDRATDIEPFPGLLAEVCVWNIALNDQDVALLAAGYHPLEVRPVGIVGYWPLVNRSNPHLDLSGRNQHMVVTGAFPATHPDSRLRNYWRRPARQIGFVAPVTPKRTPSVILQAVNRAGTY